MTKDCKYNKHVTSSSRSLALEQAYVHDVYSVIAINTSLCSPVRSHVKEFLFEEFEIGSCILDVGCGDGKYLNLKSDIVVIGLERCWEWFNKCNNMCPLDKQLVAGDVMYLPFRDDFFDGVLCAGVLHHVSTVERRVKALKEMARTLKIGGKILLTVTSGPAVGRELQSQDVLIKLDDFPHKISTNVNSSETDTESSSSGYSNNNNNNNYGNTVYESCNTPNSEFGSCYSFVRKALRKFSFTGSFGSLQSRRTSGNKSRTSNSSSLSKGDFPIELRNIEDIGDDDSISVTNDCPADCDINSINDSNRSHSVLKSSSLLSIIKEHIISFQFQFKSKNLMNNESNNNNSNNTNTNNNRNGFPHRFSLPISFKRNDNNNKSKTPLNIINRINTDIINEIHEKESNNDYNNYQMESKPTVKSFKNNKEMNRLLKKSFSSDSLSSRQASLGSTGAQLIAYYSMPELHNLSESQTNVDISTNGNRVAKFKPKILDLHPITFIDSTKTSQTTKECINDLINDKNCETICEITIKEETNNLNSNQNNVTKTPETSESSEQIEEKDILLEKEEMNDSIDSMDSNQSITQTSGNGKFPKKLLRQRSFSADYQPEVPKPQSEQPRRFSASPNIGSTRVNQIAHYQQLSIDSEESFVTIIPANRSTRQSVTEAMNNCDTFVDLEDDCLSSSTDDACYEDIIGEQTSEDNTSASSVTEITKSIAKSSLKSDSEDSQSSTPSPPTTLHRYFHVFRSGELEQLIEQNIQNLHVVNSYYNERATSWCVVVEKVHVWTI
ncbi:probable WRKY transcription factor protein 1 [Oppia nitens]|uniref:probable WRKY transcription factor protein 1 n=1 Tax=Oppia nitens TaxID=1686743 RepID=UPI0023DA26FD|nr:probable WRKY transcription factor protein 1 [Oppia nitens]